MSRKVNDLMNSINAEFESLRGTIKVLRSQLDAKPKDGLELAQKDAHIEKLRLRIKELEEELRLASRDRDHATAKLAKLKKITTS